MLQTKILGLRLIFRRVDACFRVKFGLNVLQTTLTDIHYELLVNLKSNNTDARHCRNNVRKRKFQTMLIYKACISTPIQFW